MLAKQRSETWDALHLFLCYHHRVIPRLAYDKVVVCYSAGVGMWIEDFVAHVATSSMLSVAEEFTAVRDMFVVWSTKSQRAFTQVIETRPNEGVLYV